jgi:ADP-heptose:LPS heptosyltransferase
MRVVALVPGGIDEQLLFFPTLDNLKRSYPNAEIDVVVEPRAKAAYRVSKTVSEVILFDFQDRSSPADWANLLGVVRDRYYEAALSTRPSWGIGLLLWLSGVPVRISYAPSGATYFFTNSIPLKPEQPLTQTYHDLLQGLNITTSPPDLTLSVPTSDIDWAEMQQKRLGVKGAGYVLLYPGTSFLAKGETAYPIASWQAIIQDFQQKQPDLPLVVVQGGNDQEAITTLTQAFPTLKVTQPVDIGKLAALVAGANLVLAPNGVVSLVAIALQVYTLALFGTTQSTRFLPSSDKFAGLQSPTGKLADLPPSQVLQKVWGS